MPPTSTITSAQMTRTRLAPAAVSVVLAVLLLAAPAAGEAQVARKVYRIGYLGLAPQSVESKYLEVFEQRLRELGYPITEGADRFRRTDGALHVECDQRTPA
jgi:aspartate aminotransferase-like enzyme